MDALSMYFTVVVKKLKNLFSIDKLMLEGGGFLNGSFLNEGLIDELSLILVPIADGASNSAFGSKEALFREVMQQYISTYGQVSESFSDTRMTSKAAIEQGLRRSARMQTEESHPLGCLLVLSAVNCSPEQKHIREMLANEREKVRSWIKGCIERAVSNGELPDSADIQMLATLFHTFLQGISTQARDGVPYEKIDAAITQLMSIWDAQSAKPVV
ncbi:TetR family transcriptional regulator C-terminal domain-containing protein [Bacillus atrophaeus]|uniref:TetR/AcrR family transcriptional regulator n=1 Tax=Bacillus atrophaeus TaxID=1452 RepID=UPI003873CB16